MQSPLTGRRLVSLPFSDYCPLLAKDEASANELIDQAIQLAYHQKVLYLELRAGTNEVISKRSDLVETNLYVRWLLPLHADPGTIWPKIKKPVQHQVKKSQKLGVQVRVAQQREDVAQYYRLHLETRTKKHGMPAQPQRYFFELMVCLRSLNATFLNCGMSLPPPAPCSYCWLSTQERLLPA